MTEQVTNFETCFRERKSWLKVFLSCELVNNTREVFLRNAAGLVGENGIGRYPIREGYFDNDQLGWNRGSYYKLSSLAIIARNGGLFIFRPFSTRNSVFLKGAYT